MARESILTIVLRMPDDEAVKTEIYSAAYTFVSAKKAEGKITKADWERISEDVPEKGSW